jgi:fumarate reductase flavoprotein subunit
MSEYERIECDVVIVGAGIAGMIAAVRVAQGGLRAVVLEKLPEDRYICNSRLTAGVWHCCATDILADPELLYSKIMEATSGAAQADLAKAIAVDGARVVRWMQSVGVRFIKGPYSYQSFVLSPPSVTPRGCEWNGRGGDVMLRTLEGELNRLGGGIRRGYKATGLEQTEGRVTGVTGETVTGTHFSVTAASVIIADGGFQTDETLLADYISPQPDRVFQRNAGTGTGDGLRMAQAAGAGVSNLKGFYGHVLSGDVFHIDKLSPYPYLDYIVTAGIIVDKNTERFADEGLGGVAMANAIAASEDPSDKLIIADEYIWTECGSVRLVSPNPHLLNVGATVHKANSIDELARQCGLTPEKLVSLVDQYNSAVKAGITGELTPARSTTRHQAHPIERAPFYAFPVCAGITYTMGGISINGDGQVLADSTAHPIPGLYAIGCTTGGLEGGSQGGYVGGLVKSSVTGLRAAEHIVGDRRPLET